MKILQKANKALPKTVSVSLDAAAAVRPAGHFPAVYLIAQWICGSFWLRIHCKGTHYY